MKLRPRDALAAINISRSKRWSRTIPSGIKGIVRLLRRRPSQPPLHNYVTSWTMVERLGDLQILSMAARLQLRHGRWLLERLGEIAPSNPFHGGQDRSVGGFWSSDWRCQVCNLRCADASRSSRLLCRELSSPQLGSCDKVAAALTLTSQTRQC
jgi:hypothetical protein